MALTATASPDTQEFICQSLQLVNPLVVSHTLNRPNIYFSASTMKGYQVSVWMQLLLFTLLVGMYCNYFQADLSGIAHWLKTLSPASVPKTIIFVPTKNVGCKLYSWLSKCTTSKHSVYLYHASLTQTTKVHIQSMFRKQCDLRCLVATVAFGMVFMF